MEEIIISSLVKNEDFVRIAMPFLEDEYFSQQHHKVLFKVITNYVKKYNKPPTVEAVKVEVENLNLIEPIYDASILSLNNISEETNDLQWLVEKTEQWCQDRSLYNAIMRAVKVYDGSDNDLTRSGLPELMSKALSVSFDTTIGHDYIENWEDRYDLYTKKDERLPFDIDMLNTITDGGVTKKTANLIIGGTGTGKTLGLCHLAASYMNDGKNVLYITLEMSEDKISQRIDANLMNTDIADIKLLPKDVYEKKIQRIKKNTPGKLIVKEYPTATANSNHFRHLINELKLKKKFNIDVLMVDYLNICTSARYKGGNHNSYTIAKSIAEELRGLAIEFNCVLWTATQSTRQSNVASDFEIDGISESFGVAAVSDLILAAITTEELDALGQVMIKQLKNRYNDVSKNRRFVIGIDRSRMKWFNAEQSAQEGIVDDRPAFDKSGFGEADSDRTATRRSKGFKKVEGLMV
jgi:replicative DNA helicase